MAKKSRDTGKVDNDLKKRLRANMKARREDKKCYAFGMGLNPKMKPVLGKKHRALLVVKSEDPDIDGYIRSTFATGGCGQYSKDSVPEGEDYIMTMAAKKRVVPPLRKSEILVVDSATLMAACEEAEESQESPSGAASAAAASPAPAPSTESKAPESPIPIDQSPLHAPAPAPLSPLSSTKLVDQRKWGDRCATGASDDDESRYELGRLPDADQKVVQLEQVVVELEGKMNKAIAGLDNKFRRAFAENGQVVAGLRGDIHARKANITTSRSR